MSGPHGKVDRTSAAAVRHRNAELDAAVLALAETVPPDRLHAVPPGDEWSPAHVLAHLGEFPPFFAAELRRWHGDRAAVVGRTHEHAGRLAAVSDETVAATGLAELTVQVRAGFAALAEALDRLDDSDLAATMQNVKYGEEPLTAFLHRYVIGHKAGHLRQLEAMLEIPGAQP